jgi:hypothetical protein
MKKIIRVGLLIVIVVLGFTVVFPEWFDLKDQVVVERQKEQAEAERQQQDAKNKQQYETEAAALNALQPQAEAFAEEVWRAVDAGNYLAPFDRGTARFRSAQAPADVERLLGIHTALGPKLDAVEAASKPGYDAAALSRAYPSHGPKLIVESQRWSRNAMALRTLELSHESEQLRIDAIVLDVFLYPGEESAIASDMRGAHVFR